MASLGLIPCFDRVELVDELSPGCLFFGTEMAELTLHSDASVWVVDQAVDPFVDICLRRIGDEF